MGKVFSSCLSCGKQQKVYIQSARSHSSSISFSLQVSLQVLISNSFIFLSVIEIDRLRL